MKRLLFVVASFASGMVMFGDNTTSFSNVVPQNKEQKKNGSQCDGPDCCSGCHKPGTDSASCSPTAQVSTDPTDPTDPTGNTDPDALVGLDNPFGDIDN